LFNFVMRATGCDFRRALEIVAEFCAGVACASESRSDSRLGTSEGAKPLSPPRAGVFYSQSARDRLRQILAALAETERRLVRVAITNAAASAALATACEPERSFSFTCQKPDNSHG
jgi:hypothetical protein